MADRAAHFAALSRLLEGGVRMVEAEGGQSELPAEAAWFALARYAYGVVPESDQTVRLLPDELLDSARREAAFALALLRLHLEEARNSASVQGIFSNRWIPKGRRYPSKGL